MNIYISYDLYRFHFPFKVASLPKNGNYQCQPCGGNNLLMTYNHNDYNQDYCCPVCSKVCIHSHNPEEHNEFNSCQDRFNCPNHLYICPDEEWYNCDVCDDILCEHSDEIHFCQNCKIMFKYGCLHGEIKKETESGLEAFNEIWHAGLIHQIYKDGEFKAHGMPIFQNVPEYWDLINKGYNFKFTCTCSFQKEYQNCFKKRLLEKPYNNPCILCHNRVEHNHDPPETNLNTPFEPDYLVSNLLRDSFKHPEICRKCPNDT